MDSATQGRIWYACKYYVNTHNKNLAKGSKEYYEEVAKVFEKTLTTTQSTFTTSQRPAILRSDDSIIRALTMFMTENLKNYSIMYDSFGEYKARGRDYRKNKTEQNKKDLRKSRQKFAYAVSGQLTQALLFASLTVLGNLLLYKLDRYRDDEEGDITKEKIIEVALGMVQKHGADFLSARSIAAELGCSTAPIFTAFSSIEELRAAVFERAYATYEEYAREAADMTPAFKGAGLKYIQFAKEEPELFKMIFMSSDDEDTDKHYFPWRYRREEEVRGGLEESHGYETDRAMKIYNHMAV